MLPFVKESTVLDVLQAYPPTAQVFIHLKTSCVGCWLARFCSLADVSKHYTLDLDTLLAALRGAAEGEDGIGSSAQRDQLKHDA